MGPRCSPHHHPLVATMGRPDGLEFSRRSRYHRSIDRSPGWGGVCSPCLRLAHDSRYSPRTKPLRPKTRLAPGCHWDLEGNRASLSHSSLHFHGRSANGRLFFIAGQPQRIFTFYNATAPVPLEGGISYFDVSLPMLGLICPYRRPLLDRSLLALQLLAAA